MAKQSDSIEEKLITSFNEQFATNQNFAQGIFIQFLSAILVVLVGYGYVYAATASNAHVFDAVKCVDKLISFSVAHLFGAFYIAELILTMLATVILNTGYSFRRDQLVIYKIRHKYLRSTYNDIFGTASFNPADKTLIDFLPEFTRSFFVGIIILQLLLLGSLGYACFNLTNFPFIGFVPVVGAVLISLLPILLSTFVYQNSFKKYYWIMTDSNNSWMKNYRSYKLQCKNKERARRTTTDYSS